MLLQNGCGNRSIDCFRKQIALSELAAELAQLNSLGFCFNPFRDDPDSQLVSYSDQALNDESPSIARHHAVDEGLVDLDDVDRHRQQVGQRRVTRAEVVEGNSQALGPKSLYLVRDDIVPLSEINRFRYFEDDVLERNLRFPENSAQPALQITATKICGGQVDADMLERKASGEPAPDVPRNPQQHPLGQLSSNMRVFRRLMEMRCGYDFAGRRGHSTQGFETDNFARIQAQDRLVMRVDAIVLQGDAHIANRPEASGQGGAQAGIVLHVPTTVVFFRMIERHIGVLADLVRVCFRLCQRAANRRGGKDDMAVAR